LLRIVLAIAALLIYGSLYPWEFHAARGSDGPLDALIHSWHISLNRFELRDIAVNIAIYMPFGAAAYVWLSSRRASVCFLGPVLMAAVLSTCIEIVQFYDARRFTSSVDIVTNILGAALGVALVTTLVKRGHTTAIRIQQPGAALLLCCWLGAILFPLIPDLSRTDLSQKLSTFWGAGFTPIPFYALVVGWLLAARMLLAVTGERLRNLLFPLLSLVLPTRFLVLGLSAGWEFWGSFLLAWLLWQAFLSRIRHHDLLLAWMAVLSLVATGLAPFHFVKHAQPFVWIPFRAVFSTARETGFALFLGKAFLQGATVWLFRAAGLRLRYAAAAVALLLAGLEFAQRYLPNHVAEITDPLLCILMAWMLHRLQRARVRQP